MNSKVVPFDLQCEYMTDPLGIDVHVPRFSWKLQDDESVRGQKQTGYQVLVASRKTVLENDRADVWDSGRVSSSQSTLVSYGGPKLISNQDCYWKVRVFDKDGRPSGWSSVARFSMGLLSPEDWTGPWISHPDAPAEKHIWFRRSFHLDGNARSAFIHVASVGYHELYVNGKKVDDRVLAPALTRLDKRVLYITYELTAFLAAGANTIALWTGPGWARYAYFKTHPALRVQLNAGTTDGKAFTLATDANWRAQISSSETLGKVEYKDHGGECVDARRHVSSWNAVDFDDRHWPPAAPTVIQAELSAQMMPATRIIETVEAESVSKQGASHRVVLKKNFTGWLEIKFHGLSAGDVVAIKVADDAKTGQDYGQLSRYIAAGKSVESFRHRFNYVAGRYVTLEGLKQKPKLGDVKGHAVATDLMRTGRFACSKELFNRIYETDLWTYRANTIEGFTSDCPHRERLGYGEECFATAWGIGLPNYRVGGLYTKHVRDWSDVQEESGWIHHTAPQINEHYGGPMWSSAGLNISWEFYLAHGDRRVLELNYPSSKRWLEFLNSKTTGGLLRNFADDWGKFLGDWAAPGKRKEKGGTPEALYFNNCVYVMNLKTFVEIAKVLNKPEDAALYGGRLKALRTKVHDTFYHPKRRTYSSGTQVQMAFALLTGVTPKNLQPAVFASLEKDISRARPYFDMGSSGLPVLLKYLIEDSGRADLAFAPLAKTNKPGYGYFLKRGESTWPEYWNVDVPSRMHTCYTGIAAWFTKSLAGIRPDPARPGGQSFLIQPVPAGDVTYADASTESPYGLVKCRWERNGRRLKLTVVIPPNSSATVFVPTANANGVTESGRNVRSAEGVRLLKVERGCLICEVESGHYEFESEIA